MLSVEGAPQYGHDPNETITEFIDQHFTFNKSDCEEMNDRVNIQTHRHAKICQDRAKKFVDSIFLYIR